MTKTLWFCGAALATSLLAAAAAPAAPSNAASTPIVVAQYMRAVPSGPSPVRHCRRVCVKSEGGTATHEGHCVQWQTVCS